MWYNRPKQYLRKTFSQSGLGVLLMAKKPDNTFEAAQMDANGAIKISGGGAGGNIFDSIGNPILTDDAINGILKVAVHNSGGGNVAVSTSTLQTTLNNLITTLNGLVATAANQTAQTTALNAQSNGGVLTDSIGTQALTTSYAALTSITCKYVTLVNLSTNASFQFNINNTGSAFTLQPGYSIRINTSNTNRIYIRQSTGEAQTVQYIATA